MTWASTVSQVDEQVWLRPLHRYRPLRGALWHHAAREWKLKRFKKPWYQGTPFRWASARGYWTATPIQMNKALMILINDGVVKVPHLLQSTVEDGKPYPGSNPMSRR